MAIAAWRLRSGLAMVGDSGSYLAGAAGLSRGRWFETPLVPSFSELPLLDTVRNAGWSPYADFGIGLPIAIALLDVVLPLGSAAGSVTVIAIGAIAAGVVIGPWSPTRRAELWLRSILAIALSSLPILRFTSVGVLSEPLFCAALLWLVILLARPEAVRTPRLVASGLLTILIGTTRFVGPVVAVVVALLLVQRGLERRRALIWGISTAAGPLLLTLLATSTTGTRVLAFHSLDATDVFFAARGIGGWFEAGLGDQTSTLLRLDFQPHALHWLIVISAAAGASVVLWHWFDSFRTRVLSPLQPAMVLSVTLALAVVPSMLFLDAVVKLENRTLLPSGLLVICTAGWAMFRRLSVSMSCVLLVLWTIVATHPWSWLDRPDAPRPTALTRVVESLDAHVVITNQADLVWWITRVPARYIPDGFDDLSDRSYDPRDILVELACPLAEVDGVIVADHWTLDETISRQLTADSKLGKYTFSEIEGVVTYRPTGLGC